MVNESSVSNFIADFVIIFQQRLLSILFFYHVCMIMSSFIISLQVLFFIISPHTFIISEKLQNPVYVIAVENKDIKLLWQHEVPTPNIKKKLEQVITKNCDSNILQNFVMILLITANNTKPKYSQLSIL